jgi:hypothetical protein
MGVEREGEVTLAGWCVVWKRGKSKKALLDCGFKSKDEAMRHATFIDCLHDDAKILVVERASVLVARMKGGV